jgi:predicted transcriptional regulator
MVEKGYLSRASRGAAYLYAPQISRTSTARRMLADRVDRVFGGSASAAALRLLKTSDLDAAELRALREEVDRRLRGTRTTRSR